MMCQLIQLCAMIFVLNCVEDVEHILPMAQIAQDWVAAGGSTDRHVVSALRAALEGVKRAMPMAMPMAMPDCSERLWEG